jgi:hypothetical protein
MKRKAVFISGFVFFSLLMALQVYLSYKDSGRLSYPLDDAFIHMAISKNLVEHGVWGITRFEFSSTSSSILYTLVLALGFVLAGIQVWLPLMINWLAGAWVIYLFTSMASRFVNSTASFILTISFILLVPLAGMAVLGMEHTLQVLLTMLFFYQTLKLWKGESYSLPVYFLTALLAVSTRYESAFLIGLAAGAWLLVFRNWKNFLLLMIAIALPIILFGLFALSKGGAFFPNSLLAKSNFISGSVSGYFSGLAGKFLSTGLLYSFLLLPLIYWITRPIKNIKDISQHPSHLIMLLLAATSLAHLVLASYGWLFRYEAYLVALLFVALVNTWDHWKALFPAYPVNRFVFVILGVVMLFPIISRFQMISHTRRAAKNIADQQVQMADFVNRHFPSEGIAMNDIGALTFFNNDIRIFDMEGLGTLEVIRQKKNLDSNFLRKYVADHKIGIGIFYPHLYHGKIPAEWEQVGTWELLDNFVTAGSTVGFYVIDPSLKEQLVQGLKLHEPLLPSNVIQKINDQ